MDLIELRSALSSDPQKARENLKNISPEILGELVSQVFAAGDQLYAKGIGIVGTWHPETPADVTSDFGRLKAKFAPLAASQALTQPS